MLRVTVVTVPVVALKPVKLGHKLKDDVVVELLLPSRTKRGRARARSCWLTVKEICREGSDCMSPDLNTGAAETETAWAVAARGAGAGTAPREEKVEFGRVMIGTERLGRELSPLCV
jgi:hypothetical protein